MQQDNLRIASDDGLPGAAPFQHWQATPT